MKGPSIQGQGLGFRARVGFAVHFEEGLVNDCRYSSYCCTIPRESSADHYMNTSDRNGHLDRRRSDHNHRFPGIGHHGNGPGSRPISFCCRCSSGRHPGGSHRHGATDPVNVVAHYPEFSRIAARLDGSMYS